MNVYLILLDNTIVWIDFDSYFIVTNECTSLWCISNLIKQFAAVIASFKPTCSLFLMALILLKYAIFDIFK